jgi:hypothetical protein
MSASASTDVDTKRHVHVSACPTNATVHLRTTSIHLWDSDRFAVFIILRCHRTIISVQRNRPFVAFRENLPMSLSSPASLKSITTMLSEIRCRSPDRAGPKRLWISGHVRRLFPVKQKLRNDGAHTSRALVTPRCQFGCKSRVRSYLYLLSGMDIKGCLPARLLHHASSSLDRVSQTPRLPCHLCASSFSAKSPLPCSHDFVEFLAAQQHCQKTPMSRMMVSVFLGLQ